jgi:CRP-like cAMP-binding protein
MENITLVEDVLLDRDQALFRGMLKSRELFAGEVLFWRGEEGGSVFFVVEGELSLWREELGGDQELMRFAEAGDVITPGTLLDDTPRKRCCLAERDTRVMELSSSAFRMLTAMQPDTAINVLVALGAIADGHSDSGDPAQQRTWIEQLPSTI